MKPKYIVYLTLLNREEYVLNVIRWSDKALLEVPLYITIIRKRLTENIIFKLDEESVRDHEAEWRGFIDLTEICWSYSGQDDAHELYMRANLNNIKKVLKKIDPGEIIYLYYIY